MGLLDEEDEEVALFELEWRCEFVEDDATTLQSMLPALARRRSEWPDGEALTGPAEHRLCEEFLGERDEGAWPLCVGRLPMTTRRTSMAPKLRKGPPGDSVPLP